jgi:hypothetical protein
MKKSFSIYPSIKITSCSVCPYKVHTECTFTGGPKFDKKLGPPLFIHGKCPVAKDEKDAP